MDIASLVVSIVGCILSVISIVITVKLTKRTERIEKELKDKLKRNISAGRFNEKRNEYSHSLRELRDNIVRAMGTAIGDDCWAKLDMVVKELKTGIQTVKDDYSESVLTLIDSLLDVASCEEDDPKSQNKKIISILDSLIPSLESITTIGE